MNAIEAGDLTFSYKGSEHPALRAMSLTQPEGQFLVMMGASGAGKSTFCRCLNGLIPAFSPGDLSGALTVFSESPSARSVAQMAPTVGLVFQDFESQLFATSVELEVAFGPENLGVPRDEIGRRIDDALRTVGLDQMRGRDPATLSGGEKQRLAIASVLSMQPRLVVMDEPTTDLDPAGKESVFDVARSLAASGRTVLMVEHETRHALEADRTVLLWEGTVAGDGQPAQILSDAAVAELSVRPLQIPALFKALGVPRAPLSPDDAASALREAGVVWRACQARYGEDVIPAPQATAEKRAAYGDVVIECDSLSHTYPGAVSALREASLAIRRGELVAIIGQNGGGKTTLVKHFNGLLRPTAGEVRLDGKSVQEMPQLEVARRVGYVFQNPDHQIFAETVRDEVFFGPRNFHIPEAEAQDAVADALESVGLSGREAEDPFSMTKGERQRVAVASILASRPEVLILDEPTTGLDYAQQRTMMELLVSLNERGHTIIIVTHSMWVVAEYAHRCIIMSEGRIICDAPTREAFADSSALDAARIRPPEIVALGNLVGIPALSVAEMARVLSSTDAESARPTT